MKDERKKGSKEGIQQRKEQRNKGRKEGRNVRQAPRLHEEIGMSHHVLKKKKIVKTSSVRNFSTVRTSSVHNFSTVRTSSGQIPVQ